jgi:hypothetical protein
MYTYKQIVRAIEDSEAIEPTDKLEALCYLDFLTKFDDSSFNEERPVKLLLKKGYDSNNLPFNGLLQGGINHAFYWSATPQGHDFWNKISRVTDR